MIDYKEIANDARKKVLDLIFKAQTSHIGSNFSCADIMAVLFEKIDLDKDKFFLSAGWKAAILYYFLWRKGRITEEDLNSYCQSGSKWIGLAEPIHKDIPFAGGSMGLGLSAGAACAWSKKQRKEDGTIYVLESDGGMQVGINWEAIWFAAQHKLDNLFLIIDRNDFQAMGKTKDILDCSDLDKKLESFGWEVQTVNGHNYWDLDLFLRYKTINEKPFCLIANTTKGKGISIFEGNNLYHYKQLSSEEYQLALSELNG